MDKRKPLFSVTMKDLEMQTFSVSGAGGSGKDTSNSGVRLIHKDSGARGEGREHRSVTKNRECAFTKLVATREFQSWNKIKAAKILKQGPVAIPENLDQVIRTYNFKRGTVVDHRTGVSHPIKEVLDGKVAVFNNGR